MGFVRHFEGGPTASKAQFEMVEVCELEKINRTQPEALQRIVGQRGEGQREESDMLR